MLLKECGSLLLSWSTDLGVQDVELTQISQLRERGHAATHLGEGEGESLKLREVLKEGQAAAHLGVGDKYEKI